MLVPAHYEGKRYLVSMLGDGSEWVQNIRAAGGEALIKRGRPRPIMLVEILPKDRAPILKAWCQVATSGWCLMMRRYPHSNQSRLIILCFASARGRSRHSGGAVVAGE